MRLMADLGLALPTREYAAFICNFPDQLLYVLVMAHSDTHRATVRYATEAGTPNPF